jgi:hypothetical protein
MKTSLALFTLSVLSVGARPASAEPDARAVTVGKAMWAALGGDAGWNQARYLRFDFVVDVGGTRKAARSHYWDRWKGRYRVEGADKEHHWAAYFDVNSRAGKAFVDGKPVSDEAQAKKILDDAYGAYINDTYWLLAPYKVFDPGVNLSWAGEEKGPHGETCDVLKLSFENVGLTPKDVYWFYVDRATHLMPQWKYVLGGKKEPPTVALWTEWKPTGGIQLSTVKTMTNKPVAIRFENLAVSAQPDDKALTPP